MRKMIHPGLVVLLLAGLAGVTSGGVRVTNVVTGHGLGKLAGGKTVTFIEGHQMRSDGRVGKKTLSSIIDLDAQRMIIPHHGDVGVSAGGAGTGTIDVLFDELVVRTPSPVR